MSFPGSQGGNASNNATRRGSNLNTSTGAAASAPRKTRNPKANSNPTSVEAMFQGILPPTSPSPSNPREHLSGLNLGSMGTPMGMSTMGRLMMPPGSGTAAGGAYVQTHHGIDPSHVAQPTAHATHQQLSALNSGLSEEIRRLQQLHQLTSSAGSNSQAFIG